ncbi:MAG: MFS transporter [Candidatus Dormibacteria bacterium]
MTAFGAVRPGTSRRVVAIGCAIGAQYLIATAVSLVLVHDAIGVSPGIGTLVVIAGQIPSLLIPTLAGWISDRSGRRTTLAAGTAIAVVSVLGWGVGRSYPFLLPWISFGIGCSTSIWGSAGIAALIDVTADLGEQGQEHAAVVLGWVIDIGKLIGAGVIALLAVLHGLGAYVVIIAACIAEYVGLRATGKRLQGHSSLAVHDTPKTRPNPRIGKAEMAILAGFGVIGLAGSQQSSITVFAATSSHDGLAAAGVSWAIGALLGTGGLLLATRLRPWHVWCTPVIFMTGMVGIGIGRSAALFGIGIIGLGAAVLWQAYRGMVLTKVPASLRGTYGGMVLTVATLAQSIGAAVLIGCIPLFGIRSVCDVLGIVCLLGMLPLGYGARIIVGRGRVEGNAMDTEEVHAVTEAGIVIPVDEG